MSKKPGNADVLVGTHNERADGDVGSPGDVGAPRSVPNPEWHSRGYLPHRDAEHLIQSVTYRLADSLPQTKLNELREELNRLPEEKRELESRKRIETWLDAGMGCCALRHPEVAQYVQDSFLHFHGERYHLHAWCIMPNHVHVLIEPLIDLATIVQGWKSYTARWILAQNDRLNLRIPDPKRFWMREYWDRFIRNSEHYDTAVEYIHNNPVTAGLCSSSEDWPWSSAGSADVLVGPYIIHADEDVSVPRKGLTP